MKENNKVVAEKINELRLKLNEILEELEEIKQNLEQNESKYFDLFKLTKGEIKIFDEKSSKEAGFIDHCFMEIRNNREYRGKAFYLNNKYNWELKKDTANELVLIPTKK